MPLVTDSLRTLAHGLVVVALVIAGLVYGREIILPLALATVLAFILAPLVARMGRWGVPRGAAAAVVVSIAVVSIGALSVGFSAQLLELTGDLSKHKDNIVRKVRSVVGPAGDGLFSKATASIDTLEKELRKELRGNSEAGESRVVVTTAPDASGFSNLDRVGHTLSALAQTGLTVLFTVFLLIQYHDLRDRIIRIVGTDNISVTAAALSDAGERLSHLFTMQAVLNVGFGAFVAVALAIIGVPNPMLWGLATALLRFVPYVGSFLAAIPPTLLAAGVDPGWSMMLATIAVFAVGEPIVGHVIEPLVLGRSGGISPLALIVSASFWTLLWGPVGLILAAPLTTLIVVLGQYIQGLEFMSVMLSDQPPLEADEEFYHRLIAGDAIAALPHLEREDTQQPLVIAGDDVVLPALGLAARDFRSGRIDQVQVNALRETVDEMLGLVSDNLGIDHDRKPQDGAVLVVPARGAIDEMAAKYVQVALQPATSRPVIVLSKASGLTAFASASSVLEGTTPAVTVLVSVSTLDESYAKLIAARAAREYPTSRILSYGMARPDGQVASGGSARTSSLRQIAEMISAASSSDVPDSKPAKPETAMAS